MRQNTSSPRTNLPFQCFHTCTAPNTNYSHAILFMRGASPKRLKASLVAWLQNNPVTVDMEYTGSKSGIHRFQCQIPIDNGVNLQFYSFKIMLLDSNQKIIDLVWYSSLGMSREPPLQHHCFAFMQNDLHPKWIEKTHCYQIFVDRFSSSKGFFTVDADKHNTQVPIHSDIFEYKDLDFIHCGGDLDGICNMLEYLSDLGINCIYLSPIFKASSTSKYDTEDYDLVDPHFGGNGALKRLRAKTKALGMRLILNGSFDHTGDNHPWFDRQEKTGKGAMHHKDSPYRDYYSFINDDAYYWMDNAHLPKLNYASKSVRHAIYKGKNSVIKKYLKEPYAIDGWCLDAASQIGDNGTASNNTRRLEQICKSARDEKSDCIILGQFPHDARYALNNSLGIDGAINYTGFLSPMRAFFGGVNLKGQAVPYTGKDLQRACEDYSVGLAQQTKLSLINQLDNHCLPRFFDIIGADKNLYLCALAVLYTWRGIPCLYQGDELGDIIDQYKIGPRSLIPFEGMKAKALSSYANNLAQKIKELNTIRESSQALSLGSHIFISSGGSYFAYTRLYGNSFALIFVNVSRQNVKIDQGSILFPLLSCMYLPEDAIENDNSDDQGDSLLIPLSGKNVRRTDRGEGLEALYELLSRETLEVFSFGLKSSSDEFKEEFSKELIAGKTITMPARSCVIVKNII